MTRTTSESSGICQLASHAKLLTDVSSEPIPGRKSRRGRPDAIIVPATRPPSALSGVVELAAELETPLIVLYSKQQKVNIDRVVERIEKVWRARGVVVDLNEYKPDLPSRTASDAFRDANAGRESDLSMKRNFGLLLARLSGWSKLVFIDDDITVSWQQISRLTDQLDSHRIAGMVCRDFPDNSVVCHARRLAKFRQDNFVTGAVMGVNCNDHPLPFFPDIYNEDWFSFAELVAKHELANAGNARQAAYDPFEGIDRARREEFGDLLAEGLYTLFEINGPSLALRQHMHYAKRRYWDDFIAARVDLFNETLAELREFKERKNCSDDVDRAISSLESAQAHLESEAITAELCVEFLERWQEDLAEWKLKSMGANSLGGPRQALEHLGAPDWKVVLP